MKFLKHTANGRVFPWSELLAARPDMVPCDEQGRPIMNLSSLPEGVFTLEQLQAMSEEELTALLGRQPQPAAGLPDLPASPDELHAMTKDQLLELASACGVDSVKYTDRKDTIIDALEKVLWPDSGAPRAGDEEKPS